VAVAESGETDEPNLREMENNREKRLDWLNICELEVMYAAYLILAQLELLARARYKDHERGPAHPVHLGAIGEAVVNLPDQHNLRQLGQILSSVKSHKFWNSSLSLIKEARQGRAMTDGAMDHELVRLGGAVGVDLPRLVVASGDTRPHGLPDLSNSCVIGKWVGSAAARR